MIAPTIVGEGKTYMAKAFDDVREWMRGHDVILFAQMARLLGEDIPPGANIYNMEPLTPGCGLVNMGYLDLLRGNRVFDYQRKNIPFLRAHGIDATHIPYGHHEALERVPQAEEDIDVLFFGGVNDRRIRVLKALEQSGMACHIVTYGCYGADLDALVSRARIVLNMHYQDTHPLEVVRINYLLANKKFVVSERGWDDQDNALYSPGMAYADYDALIGTCRKYLRDANARQAIAEAGLAVVRGLKSDLSCLRRS